MGNPEMFILETGIDRMISLTSASFSVSIYQ